MRPRGTARRSRSCRSPRRQAPRWRGRRGDRRSLGLAAAQTPQGVRRDLLRGAYARFPPNGPETWTDEAALLEACSIAVHVVPGEPGNLKVTLPGDLERVAAALAGRRGRPDRVRARQPSVRTRLAARARRRRDRRRARGSTAIRTATSRSTRSPTRCSGRPAWAISVASSRPTRGRRAASPARTLLARGPSGGSTAAGWRPVAVDLTIVAARPRLAATSTPMRAAIAGLLGVDLDAVNVKASTGNLDGDDGAGRSISALGHRDGRGDR